MSRKNLLTQITECLKLESEQRSHAEIDPAVLKDFMQLGKNAAAKPADQQVNQAPKRNTLPEIRRPSPSPASNNLKETLPVKSDNENTPVEKIDLSKMTYEDLEKKAAGCTRCRLSKSRTNPVFADGNRKAELMFIGEGPGRDEDEQGVPFVGRAGQLLTKMIEAMQFARKDVYIANIVKCRPPENRAPMDDEAEQCLPYLLRQIELIQPKVIVLLGAVPLKYILGLTGITRIRGNWKEFKGIKVMPTLHPAYLLRNPPAKKDAWDDLQKVMAVFGKQHKGTSKN